MKTAELKRLLKKHGCYKEHEGGSHEIWFSPKTGIFFQVGRHNSQEVKTGTVEKILKDAGIK